MSINEKNRPAETVPGMGGKWWWGEFNYGILDIDVHLPSTTILKKKKQIQSGKLTPLFRISYLAKYFLFKRIQRFWPIHSLLNLTQLFLAKLKL
jgi:hypothetical protein